jgi:hypothetical protein
MEVGVLSKDVDATLAEVVPSRTAEASTEEEEVDSERCEPDVL